MGMEVRERKGLETQGRRGAVWSYLAGQKVHWGCQEWMGVQGRNGGDRSGGGQIQDSGSKQKIVLILVMIKKKSQVHGAGSGTGELWVMYEM